MMGEIWDRAVETALDGQTEAASVRSLTLDGAVKCAHGRLPHPSPFQKFSNLQQLSIASIGVSSLEQFPHLQNLQKLILSDNRIAGGLEFLVQAGLDSLRDLDLSNNRLQEVDDLRPLAALKLVSLDLYECPVTRVKDFRARVFLLIKSLKYLDKMDIDENERPESDDEDEDEDDDDDEEEEEHEEDDPGSGEIVREERGLNILTNGRILGQDGVVEVDEDDESDADVVESDVVRGLSENGSSIVAGQANGYHGEPINVDDVDDDNGDDESDEIDEEEGEDEEDVIEDSDDEEDGVEDVDDDEVDTDDGVGEPGSNGWVTSTEGEIDGHEQGEEDADEDDDGETGEEEINMDEGDFEDDENSEDEEEEDEGTGYLVQPVGQVAEDGVFAGDEEDDPEVDEEEEEVDEEEEEVDEVDANGPSSSSKRKRNGDDEHPHNSKSSKHN